MKKIKFKIAVLLEQMGIAKESCGYAYLVDAVALLVEKIGAVGNE